jgi:ketosteroid isomerase-like protein
MTAEQNAEVVRKTWQDLIGGRLEAALVNMSDEVSWLIPGNVPNVSGLKRGKEEVRKFVSGIGQAFPQGLQSEIRKTHVAGDTVIVELTNRGKAFNGKDYENEYCFVFELEGGKIRRIREYVDMHEVVQTLS